VVAENEVRIVGEPAVHADGALVLGGRADLIKIEPGNVALGLGDLALAEEEDVDDGVRAGIAAEAALGQRIAAIRLADLAMCSRAVRLPCPSCRCW
jgi:hypothetical protein